MRSETSRCAGPAVETVSPVGEDDRTRPSQPRSHWLGLDFWVFPGEAVTVSEATWGPVYRLGATVGKQQATLTRWWMGPTADGCCATRVIFLSVLCCLAYGRGAKVCMRVYDPVFPVATKSTTRRREGSGGKSRVTAWGLLCDGDGIVVARRSGGHVQAAGVHSERLSPTTRDVGRPGLQVPGLDV